MGISEVRSAYERVSAWLAEAVVAGGDFERDGWTYRGLFKAPLALARMGLTAAANRSVDALKDRLMKPDGDFHDPTSDPHPAPSLEYFYTYRTAWISMGAHIIGRYDVARKTGAFVLSYQDPATGGFLSHPDRPPTRHDLCGTGQATLAALTLGAWDAAERAGAFLLRILEAQPDEGRFYYVVDENDRLITDVAEDTSGYSVFLKEEPGQTSYPLGLAMTALAQLHLASGETRFLAGATSYFEILTNAHREVYTNTACGKLARGAALLYHMTGDARYRVASLKAAETLCATVNREPTVHVVDWYPDPDSQPATITYEIAFEYAHALSVVLQYLGDT